MDNFEILSARVSTDKTELKRQISIYKFKGEKIVFTNGCFDILHRGHIEYLAKAADLGDVLIIGLNTDGSVKRLKGESRPVQDEDSRAINLSALRFVDHVIMFDEDTPYELIKELQPDILVKGSDYKEHEIVGFDIVKNNGGKVETIDFVEGYSTTDILKKACS
ncbi:MAG: D-glycero-beta-D-manno-heptose 1-phosphate adenylyltransferase [Bacteroidetes bacterium 4572_117]|nr:MAG: D-glycero-beta-D-manno-heptose 1-phosphate adenylyltransferase [Bacteroidetes bacterium 4572_117]